MHVKKVKGVFLELRATLLFFVFNEHTLSRQELEITQARFDQETVALFEDQKTLCAWHDFNLLKVCTEFLSLLKNTSSVSRL